MANWYVYMGGDPLSAASYRKTGVFTTVNPPNCNDGCQICAVLLNDTTHAPTTPFTFDLINLILDGLASGLHQTDPASGITIVRLKC